MKRRVSGFTLMEILFVTLAIAILASIGAFEYVNSYRQSLMKNTTNDLVALLHVAQQKAVAQEGGNAWGVYFDNTNSTNVFADLYAGNAYATSSVSQVYQIPYQLSLTSPAAGQVLDMNFQKFSGIPSATGTIILQLNASTQTRTITVTSQGGISSN